MSLVPLLRRGLVLTLCVLVAACDQLGIESGTEIAARKEMEGKAIGSACRQAMRALEDCYTLNKRASKAAIFAGWREMDEYMRENKLEGIAPVIPRTPPAPPADGETAAPDAEPAAKDKAPSH